MGYSALPVARLSELLDDFFYRPDEDPGPLFEVGPAVEPVAQAATDEVPEEFLAFALDQETYALPVSALREIVKVPALTEIPRPPKSLLGVMNLRGEVLPVYDLKPRLRLPPARPLAEGAARSARVLVVMSDEGDAGLLVDAVADVVRLRPSTIEAPPPGVAGGERDCVVGLGRRGDALFILIDVDQALA
jgi:purine-binding chemotaxis protein CheW